MRPRVILHNEVSLDGLDPDMGLFYGLASRLQADAILAGCDTLLAAFPGGPDDGRAPAGDEHRPLQFRRPLLAVVDSRGRIDRWGRIRSEPWWGDVVVLCSRSTPPAYLEGLERCGIPSIIVGEERVDLRAALERLSESRGVRSLRVESGGTLNGALLRQGLVDEVSVLVEARLVGGTSPSSLYRASDVASSEEAVRLRLRQAERVARDSLWLRYDVIP